MNEYSRVKLNSCSKSIQYLAVDFSSLNMDIDLDLKNVELQEKRRRITSSDDSDEGGPSEQMNDSIMNIDDIEEDFKNNPRRSGRKKMRPVENNVNLTEKRRVITAPKKLCSFDATAKDIKNYYLDKRVKLANHSLETIFEEPKKSELMSVKRFRRSIHFTDINSFSIKNQMKVKKRAMKAKKVKTFKKMGKKAGIKLLMEKLAVLEDDNISNDT